jgi:vancomycin permeability regulator SanA
VGEGKPTGSRRRWRRWLLVGVILIPVVYLAATFVQVWVVSHRDDTGRADAAVVLGAAQYNGRPSPVLQGRLDHADDLWKSGRVPMIVLTGSKRVGDRFTEAYAGFQYLRKRGVPEKDLVIVDNGTNTWESLEASVRQLDRKGIRQVVLVSDPYHSERLLGIAGEVGLDATVSPTSESPSFGQLFREAAIVSVGRIIGYRRVTRLAG